MQRRALCLIVVVVLSALPLGCAACSDHHTPSPPPLPANLGCDVAPLVATPPTTLLLSENEDRVPLAFDGAMVGATSALLVYFSGDEERFLLVDDVGAAVGAPFAVDGRSVAARPAGDGWLLASFDGTSWDGATFVDADGSITTWDVGGLPIDCRGPCPAAAATTAVGISTLSLVDGALVRVDLDFADTSAATVTTGARDGLWAAETPVFSWSGAGGIIAALAADGASLQWQALGPDAVPTGDVTDLPLPAPAQLLGGTALPDGGLLLLASLDADHGDDRVIRVAADGTSSSIGATLDYAAAGIDGAFASVVPVEGAAALFLSRTPFAADGGFFLPLVDDGAGGDTLGAPVAISPAAALSDPGAPLTVAGGAGVFRFSIENADDATIIHAEVDGAESQDGPLLVEPFAPARVRVRSASAAVAADGNVVVVGSHDGVDRCPVLVRTFAPDGTPAGPLATAAAAAGAACEPALAVAADAAFVLSDSLFRVDHDGVVTDLGVEPPIGAARLTAAGDDVVMWDETSLTRVSASGDPTPIELSAEGVQYEFNDGVGGSADGAVLVVTEVLLRAGGPYRLRHHLLTPDGADHAFDVDADTAPVVLWSCGVRCWHEVYDDGQAARVFSHLDWSDADDPKVTRVSRTGEGDGSLHLVDGDGDACRGVTVSFEEESTLYEQLARGADGVMASAAPRERLDLFASAVVNIDANHFWFLMPSAVGVTLVRLQP